MPNWQPVSVPDLCPGCGAYWECACFEGTALRVEDMQAAKQGIKDAPTKADLTFGTSEEARRKPLPDVEYLARQMEEPPFDPNVQPVLRYIEEDDA